MKNLALLGAVALSMGAATAANAVNTTFVVAGAAGSSNTGYTYTAANGRQIKATAATYTVAPTAIALNGSSFSAFNKYVTRAPLMIVSGNPRVGSGGLGINGSSTNGTNGEASGESPQIDTNGNPNEVLRIATTGRKSTLVSARFNYVDNDDTLRIYGYNGNVLTLLGYTGEFFDNPLPTVDVPMGGGATVTKETAGGLSNDTVFRVDFANVGKYDGYYFTSNLDTADGYRLGQITLAVVPEPVQWAMIVGGFGLLGASARRRRGSSATVYA